jgi:hypothetical protein
MKKRFIATILIAAVSLTGCATKGEDKTEEVKTECFNFTSTEIVSNLEELLIEFTPITVVDNEEKREKIATYASQDDVFTTDNETEYGMIHYQFTYDDLTDKVSTISFHIDRNSPAAARRYLYHIYSIASCIDPNANDDDISNAIESGFKEYDFAIYEGENFKLNAFRSDNYFDASFRPIEKHK